MARMADAAATAPVKVLPGIALTTKRMLTARIGPATGGDMRLSGVGRRGARIGVRYTITRGGTEAWIAARGPLHLLERGTRGHEITPKRKHAVSSPALERSRRDGAGRTNAAARVTVRGTRARHVWGRAVSDVAPDVGRFYAQRVSERILAAYRGGARG